MRSECANPGLGAQWSLPVAVGVDLLWSFGEKHAGWPRAVTEGGPEFLIEAERLLTLLDDKVHREPVTLPQRRETVR